jgi:hypothetical protein
MQMLEGKLEQQDKKKNGLTELEFNVQEEHEVVILWHTHVTHMHYDRIIRPKICELRGETDCFLIFCPSIAFRKFYVNGTSMIMRINAFFALKKEQLS